MKGSLAYFGIVGIFVVMLMAEIAIVGLTSDQSVHVQRSGSLQASSDMSSQTTKKYNYGLDSHRTKVLQTLVRRR